MAYHETVFAFAERGPISVYKFRLDGDPTDYVWFVKPDGKGALYRSKRPGPYRSDEPLEPAEFATLEELLESRGATKDRWLADLMAQYGERIHWTYP